MAVSVKGVVLCHYPFFFQASPSEGCFECLKWTEFDGSVNGPQHCEVNLPAETFWSAQLVVFVDNGKGDFFVVSDFFYRSLA